ncbi:MAG: ABC transporter ATP-binding protein [Alphaproteobacteria bacterium]|nr:ABC transporter ATP-binding protein [Alphaproteobacteria bacterium]
MTQVELKNVSVNLPIYDADSRILRKALFKRRTGGDLSIGPEVFVRALKNISFRLEDGDRIGLIGHNGSGKTTLLRLLAGVYAPTAGEILIEGRISALLNAGLGIDMEDTGYENIANIGLMLGLTMAQVRERRNEIGKFSGLGEYLALPVRTYSAGMLLRLSFAVVTAIEPEILLLDEGLGAGDLEFAEAAQNRIGMLIDRVRVLVLASHSEDMIRQFCNRAVLLEQGEIVVAGHVGEVLDIYHSRNAGSQPMRFNPDKG